MERMAPRITPEAIDRAERTMQAASVLRENANVIAIQCEYAQADQVVLAVVTPELAFGSAEIIPLAELGEYVRSLRMGIWYLVFSPRTTVASIQKRCDKMKSLAAQRLAAMRRWIDNQATPPPV